VNSILLSRIQLVRDALSADPDGVVIGKLRAGRNLSLEDFDAVLRPFIEFLQVCDGASCGAIDFRSSDVLKDQHFIDHLPGGERDWVHIGQAIYEPLVISRTDGGTYLFARDPEPERPVESFGDFDNFLLEYVFGEKYSAIIVDAEDDDWYRLLQRLGLAQPHP